MPSLVNFNFTTLVIEIEGQLKDTREQMHEHQAHLKALENGEKFVPILKKTNKSPVSGKKKRKGTGKNKQGPPKRRRTVDSDADEEDELMESDEDFSDNSGDSDSDVDSDSDADSDSDVNSDHDDENAKSSGEEPDPSEFDDEEPNSSENEDEDITELTESDLKEKIQEAKAAIKSSRKMLSSARTTKKEAIDALSSVEKGNVKIQREKNAFCSLKRSEVSTIFFDFFVNNIF